jgi:MFS transporter, DHA1 family, tetracycline resistance protein
MADAQDPFRRRPAAFVFVFAALLLDMLALGVIVPVLPKLVIAFEGGNQAAAAKVVGVFGAAWALMQFVCSPILGALSDRFGRRPVLLLSLAGLALDYVLMALAPSLIWLFVGRLISGVTSATYATANAYIVDVTPPERRAQAFGLMGAAWGVGFVLGPVVGGLLGEIDLRLPFWVTFANVLYGLFVLPESLPKERRAPFRWSTANPVGALGLLRSRRGLLALAGVFLLYALAHHSLPNIFVIYADYRYGWDLRTIGLCVAAIGVAGVITQVLLIKPVVARIGERGALLAGLCFSSLGYLAYGLASQGWMAWAALPLLALAGFTNPGLQGLATRRVEPDEQGRLQGALGSVQGLTSLVGPLLFTFVFAASIPGRPGLAFYLASALAFLAFLGAIRWARAPLGSAMIVSQSSA